MKGQSRPTAVQPPFRRLKIAEAFGVQHSVRTVFHNDFQNASRLRLSQSQKRFAPDCVAALKILLRITAHCRATQMCARS
jgi:hypothetical protein